MNQQQAALIHRLCLSDADIAVMFPDVATRHYGIVREWGGRGGCVQVYEGAKWVSCEHPNFVRSWDYRLAPASGEWVHGGSLYEGMTLRDHFAAKAMAGICADPGMPNAENTAAIAYRVADAMLKAREVKP